jgi:hypothetical protein
MRQTATFMVSTAGVDRPSAGTRGAGMAFGGGERLCPDASGGGWERIRSGAVTGR